MTVQASEDIVSLLQAEECPIDRFPELRSAVFQSIDRRRELETTLESFDRVEKGLSSENKAIVRRGVFYWLLGDHKNAVDLLEKARPTKEGMYVLGLCYHEEGRSDRAVELFQKVQEAEPGSLRVRMSLANALIKTGQVTEALEMLEKLESKFGGQPDYHYQRGFCYDILGRYEDAEREYTKALSAHPEHQESIFRMAYNSYLRGDDDGALELYERLRKMRPPHIGSLLNLGVMYEDRGEYRKAVTCYQSILEAYPNHERARLFLKDADAALYMYYDEEIKRREHGWKRVLATPIADLQLSVRSRNCLTQMHIVTLGDLVKKTEDELRSVRNLGERSLKEIKDLLQAKGLNLSQPGADASVLARLFQQGGAQGREDILAKSVSEFEWSARSKKCLERLKLANVSDLVSKSERELLACKNFGQTSLAEVKQKLASLGLSLKPSA